MRVDGTSDVAEAHLATFRPAVRHSSLVDGSHPVLLETVVGVSGYEPHPTQPESHGVNFLFSSWRTGNILNKRAPHGTPRWLMVRTPFCSKQRIGCRSSVIARTLETGNPEPSTLRALSAFFT